MQRADAKADCIVVTRPYAVLEVMSTIALASVSCTWSAFPDPRAQAEDETSGPAADVADVGTPPWVRVDLGAEPGDPGAGSMTTGTTSTAETTGTTESTSANGTGANESGTTFETTAGSTEVSHSTGHADSGSEGTEVTEGTATATTATTTPTTTSDTTGGEPLPPLALRITEIHPDPEGKDGGATTPEFVELLFIGAQATSLASLQLSAQTWPKVDAQLVGLANATIEPGDMLVLERYESPDLLPSGRPSHDSGVWWAAFASSGSLRNGYGFIEVGVASEADGVCYGDQASECPGWSGVPASAPSSGVSLCRSDPSTDADGPTDWQTCIATPGAPPLPDSDVAIVEVFVDPPGTADDTLQFVEVRNLGTTPVSLAGWSLVDSMDAPPDEGLLFEWTTSDGCAAPPCLLPNQLAVIVGSNYADEIEGAAVVLAPASASLVTSGLVPHSALFFRDASASVRSSYRAWSDPTVEPDPAENENALVRSDPRAADLPSAWTFALPTPGTAGPRNVQAQRR